MVNRQYGDAEKANRFGLARNGLMGGSADVDSNARLQEMTNEGLVKAGGIADNAASALRTADESARQSLISMAQSGIDTGTAQQMAQQQLESTSQRGAGGTFRCIGREPFRESFTGLSPGKDHPGHDPESDEQHDYRRQFREENL